MSGRDNETLALAFQQGEAEAAELLLAQNRGYLIQQVNVAAKSYGLLNDLDDLLQEASWALLDAAGRFNADFETKLLTYATPIIRARLLAYAKDAPDWVCLGDKVWDIAINNDPARIVYQRWSWRYLQAELKQLTAREQSLIEHYCGLDADGEPHTFAWIALRLDMASPSAAEKAYKKAVAKLQKAIEDGDFSRWRAIYRLLYHERWL